MKNPFCARIIPLLLGIVHVIKMFTLFHRNDMKLIKDDAELQYHSKHKSWRLIFLNFVGCFFSQSSWLRKMVSLSWKMGASQTQFIAFNYAATGDSNAWGIKVRNARKPPVPWPSTTWPAPSGLTYPPPKSHLWTRKLRLTLRKSHAGQRCLVYCLPTRQPPMTSIMTSRLSKELQSVLGIHDTRWSFCTVEYHTLRHRTIFPCITVHSFMML